MLVEAERAFVKGVEGECGEMQEYFSALGDSSSQSCKYPPDMY